MFLEKKNRASILKGFPGYVAEAAKRTRWNNVAIKWIYVKSQSNLDCLTGNCTSACITKTHKRYKAPNHKDAGEKLNSYSTEKNKDAEELFTI